MAAVMTLTFSRALAHLSPAEREAVADWLSTIACEVLKGEHRMTSQIVFEPQVPT